MGNIYNSGGVNGSNWVGSSRGVNNSDGVNWSDGVDSSGGVSWSGGISWSYGVLDSFGVDQHIFCAHKKRTAHIFGVEVTQVRFDEVWDELFDKLGDWFPKFDNSLKIHSVTQDDLYEAWKDMPQEAIDYLVGLEEFDAQIFEEVTGIDVEQRQKNHYLYKGEKPVSQETIDKALEEYFLKN